MNYQDLNIWKQLVNSKNSNSYFFEVNHFSEYKDFIIEFIKYLFKDDILENNTISNKIDNNIFSDLLICDSSELYVSRNDVTEIIEFTNLKPLEGKYRVFWITDASKLTSVSGNALLKTLEDSKEDVIAILSSNTRYDVLDTIVSRLPIFRFENDDLIDVKDEYESKYYPLIIKLIELESPNELFLFVETILKQEISDQKDLIDFIDVFEEIILYNKNFFFKVNNELFFEYKDRVRSNVNINLFLDLFMEKVILCK